MSFIQALVRKFSNAAADLERLKKTTAELKVSDSRLYCYCGAYIANVVQIRNLEILVCIIAKAVTIAPYQSFGLKKIFSDWYTYTSTRLFASRNSYM